MPAERSNPRWPHLLLGAYLLLCAAMLTWPCFDWFGNRIDPFILGLPLSLAWNVGWIVATCVALWIYYLATEREG